MSIRADQIREETPSRTRRGWYGTEQWEVWYDDGTGQYNESGYCDPKLFEGVAGLPKYGTAGPLTNSLYTDVRVFQVLANWSYLVMATYSSFGLYTGGPRPLNGVDGLGPIQTVIDIYQSQNNAANTVTTYWWIPFVWQREVSLRLETRFVPGNAVTAIQDALDANAGKWYNLGNQRFATLTTSRCGAWYDGHAYTRVTYAFLSRAAHPGIPVGSPTFRNANAVPPLNGFQDWAKVVGPVAPNTPPTINVVNVVDNAGAGGPLPGYP